MKCDSFVLWVDARRKGSGEPYRRIKETVSWWQTTDLGITAGAPRALSSQQYLANGYVLCDGQIEARVRAVDEPFWGGSSATLEVTYKCPSCGQDFFPELPEDADALSAFVTEQISRGIGSLARDELRAQRRDKRL